MPDATRGFIKTAGNDDLLKIGMGPMAVNTYHLFLQPGIEIIKKAGGIHKFMDWPGPLLSDSGGYQVFSLIRGKTRNPAMAGRKDAEENMPRRGNEPMGRVTDRGVIFKSPLDGKSHELTPEKAIKIQFDLGVDMMVCLDDCPPNNVSKEEIEKSVERTIAWARRCKKEYNKKIAHRKSRIVNRKRPLLFAVIQGGPYMNLRKYCAEELVKIGFDGYGFGARHIGAKGEFLDDVLAYTAALIPENSLRFALGIGTPEDIIKCVSCGWDMFDCVIPTREGRHGKIFLKKNFEFLISNFKFLKNAKKFYETVNITNSKFARDFSPINADSKLSELRQYSKAYLNHLFKLKEPLGQRLVSLNNLEFYLDLMKKVKAGID